LLILVLTVAMRNQLLHRRESTWVVMLLGQVGSAPPLAAVTVDRATLSGGKFREKNPGTWNG
jgi:hypothetical protein